jgi:hypothetical protein
VPGKGRFRWRTRIRSNLPWFLVDRDVAAKGQTDCGNHEWYHAEADTERCYHCTVGLRPWTPRSA